MLPSLELTVYPANGSTTDSKTTVRQSLVDIRPLSKPSQILVDRKLRDDESPRKSPTEAPSCEWKICITILPKTILT
jgi:hypothetical protein